MAPPPGKLGLTIINRKKTELFGGWKDWGKQSLLNKVILFGKN